MLFYYISLFASLTSSPLASFVSKDLWLRMDNNTTPYISFLFPFIFSHIFSILFLNTLLISFQRRGSSYDTNLMLTKESVNKKLNGKNKSKTQLTRTLYLGSKRTNSFKSFVEDFV